MNLWSKIAREGASPVDPVAVARSSLRTLSERGVKIPSGVATPIIRAQKLGKLENASPELERDFWAAYSTLNSRIKSTEEAKDHYRRFFYAILAALLVLQLYYSASVAVQTRLLDVGKALNATEIEATEKPEKIAKFAAKKTDLEREQATYLHVTEFLMGPPQTLTKFLGALGMSESHFSIDDREDVVAKVELELATSFVGGFLLPILYGMLGAIAFILRRLSADDYAQDTSRSLRNRFSLRVPIGALSGLAAGWLLQPSTAGVPASLSPFALAFVAGYSAELVFAAMDRIVAAFTSPPKDEPKPPVEDESVRPDDGAPPAKLGDEDGSPAAAGAGVDEADRSSSQAPEGPAPSSRAEANRDA
ncbi:putative membrane protein [Bradyrhizobium elkanii]|uniref:hypothetical protein n=1 Tax=Bradyrhizobium elkanii TaxID=29448 RepID=UPI002167DC76|nr:hypothetical protein [Bradyrhizobium elkanii]MCS3695041.1 putative membrane protein [Bradyrhizobium elkanii]